MKSKPGFLGIRIARRVLLLFCISAFIPVAALAVLSLDWVGDLVVTQGRSLLGERTRDYGQAVYQRLVLADDLLGFVAQGGEGSVREEKSRAASLTGPFKSVWIVDRSGSAQALLGGPLPGHILRAYLDDPGSRLIAGPAVPDGAPVFLARKAGSRALMAELDPGYLWGDPDALEQAGHCVLNESHARLVCAGPLSTAALEGIVPQLAEKASGDITWREGESEYLSSHWDLFTGARFGVPQWTILSTSPMADENFPLRDFRSIFLHVLGIAILTAALLSLTQVRRIMVPLTRLLEGTRRLASGDFRARVEVSREDEFGQLAGAFNGMAGQLGRQFDALTALAEIDRAILSESRIETIIASVIAFIESMDVVDSVWITCLESGLKPARVCRAGRGDKSALEWTQPAATLGPEGIVLVAGAPEGRWMSARDVESIGLAPGETGRDAQHLAFPVVGEGRTLALMTVVCRERAGLTAEVRDVLRKIVDRFGVALSSAAKDERLYRQAHFDPLTGLPNRLLFVDRLEQEIAHARRDDRKLALLFVDLDRFKDVNDTLGHGAGDEVLVESARRLRDCVRDSDSVARFGGDEFTVVATAIADSHTAAAVCASVIAALSEPFVISGQRRHLNASIGIAVYPDDGTSAADLLRNADTAMYRSKASGRGRFTFFEDGMNRAIQARIDLERELRLAIERDEFVAYFQPQIDLSSGLVVSAEALVRWQHPSRGLLAPGKFIGAAEEAGLIREIDYLVLRKACRAMRSWLDRDIGLARVSVNMSAYRIKESDLVKTAAAALAEYGIEPRRLELEITESMPLEDMSAVLAMLGRLRESGVRVAIDDFGTGYSSLHYLSKLPFDVLKVDRIFIRDLTTDAGAAAVTRSIIAMAHSLGKQVVAEGVETSADLAFLENEDCDMGQGYFFSRPLAPDQFIAYVQETNRGEGR
jgi:diguanylate cyclase (GGDEF)-like protein